MTQLEINQVIHAAISFGMEYFAQEDLSGELHDVKLANIQLQEENAELKAQLESLNNKVETLKEMCDSKDEHIAQLEIELDKANQTINQSTKFTDEMNTRLKTVISVISDASQGDSDKESEGDMQEVTMPAERHLIPINFIGRVAAIQYYNEKIVGTVAFAIPMHTNVKLPAVAKRFSEAGYELMINNESVNDK